MWRISFWQKNVEEWKVEERRCLEQRGPSVLLDQNILNTAQTLSGWRWCAGVRMKKNLAGFAQKENVKVGLFR